MITCLHFGCSATCPHNLQLFAVSYGHLIMIFYFLPKTGHLFLVSGKVKPTVDLLKNCHVFVMMDLCLMTMVIQLIIFTKKIIKLGAIM